MAFSRSPRKKAEPLDEAALFNYALGVLARRMRTVAELKRLMRKKLEEGDAGEAKMNSVVLRLKELRYLNDTAFASEYTRLRQDNEKFGRRRVHQELMHKGVHKDLIAKTLDAAYNDISEEDLARRFLARKRVKQPTNEKETARVMRMMMRGGFAMGAIVKILRQWNVDEEAIAALEQAEIDESSTGSE